MQLSIGGHFGRVGRALLLLAIVLSLTGCGVRRGDVRGTVTYRGKPVIWGNVAIIASDNLVYYGSIHPDGTYLVRQVPEGPFRLTVTSPDPYYESRATPEQKAEVAEKRRKAGMEMLEKPPKGKWFPIPSTYSDPNKSGLAGKLEGPTTVFDCPLK